MSKKERFFFYNSLACVVKALEGKHTTVDLRKEASATGLIKEVDGYMNVDMEDVTFLDPKGNRYFFETFFVQARNIIYVHIPEGLSAAELIESQINAPPPPRKKPEKRPMTFKAKRAQKYHEETVRLIGQQQASTSKT